MPEDILQRLSETISARRSAASGASYTKQLLESGPERCARKLGEEAIETVIAGISQDDSALVNEGADLIFHLMVLLESRGRSIEDVLQVLEGRMGRSGLEEKASRPGSAKPAS